MPLSAQRLDHDLSHGFPAFPTLGAVAVGMTSDTPRVPVLLDKRRVRVEGIAALRAEEMAGVPVRAARNDDLAFDWGLAGFAAW